MFPQLLVKVVWFRHSEPLSLLFGFPVRILKSWLGLEVKKEKSSFLLV